jgi:hypothetical protein
MAMQGSWKQEGQDENTQIPQRLYDHLTQLALKVLSENGVSDVANFEKTFDGAMKLQSGHDTKEYPVGPMRYCGRSSFVLHSAKFLQGTDGLVNSQGRETEWNPCIGKSLSLCSESSHWSYQLIEADSPLQFGTV